jgi:hypothetical protein
VPWCATCDRFLSPSTVKVDGTCPTCGRAVDPGHAQKAAVDDDVDAAEVDPESEDEEPLGPIPWHLKLLAAALALYLGFRAWQGIEWLAHQF